MFVKGREKKVTVGVYERHRESEGRTREGEEEWRDGRQKFKRERVEKR